MTEVHRRLSEKDVDIDRVFRATDIVIGDYGDPDRHVAAEGEDLTKLPIGVPVSCRFVISYVVTRKHKGSV
jgi:hypothetical protein